MTYVGIQVQPRSEPLATLDEDYSSAVVRLAWAVQRGGNARLLLCAGVELVPQEIPPPRSTEERCEKLSDRFFLYACDITVTAREGIAWFEATATGASARPKNNSLPAAGENAPLFASAGWAPEPVAPAMVLPDGAVPYVTTWHQRPRVRHLIATKPPQQQFNRKEEAGAGAWLLKETNVDFNRWTEFWGSVHLIAPNPVFRSLRVQHFTNDAGSTFVATFVPRVRKSLEGLQLVVEEELATGLGVLAVADVREPIVSLEVNTRLASVRERVTDVRRGALWDNRFGTFNGGFSVSMSIGDNTRTVPAEEPGDDEYTVRLQVPQQPKVVVPGRPRLPAAQMIHAASAERTRIDSGNGAQMWFREKERDAVVALRKIVGEVGPEVTICDPYFGGREIRAIVRAIANPTASVRILTSAEHLRRRRNKSGLEGQYLAERVAAALNEADANPIEVHVMTGKADIHDRFLWTGHQLWMLGSSINRIGSRGTLLIRVPDFVPVMQDLHEVYRTSPSLAQWLADRRPTQRFRRWDSALGKRRWSERHRRKSL